MEYGFMMAISPREPIDRFARLAKIADDRGFTMAWVGDSQLIFKNAYVAMALAAIQTTRIRIGPGVTPAVTRHFTEIANAISAINELSQGRAILGLGVGDSSVRPLGLKPASVDELHEYVTVIRSLCSGEEIQYRGTQVHMRTFDAAIPIYISASQPRMLRLAGAVADGVVLLGAADRSVTEWQLRYIDEGARSVGRTLDDVFVDLYVGISVTDDVEKGRQEVRAYATSQARWFSRWKVLPDVLLPYETQLQQAYRAYDFYDHVSRHANHNQIIGDELVELIAIVGPSKKCAARIIELMDLKIDRISFLNLPGGREYHLEQLITDVIPLLAKVIPT